MPRLLWISLMLSLAACGGRLPARVGIYHGLVPENFAPTRSPDRLLPARMAEQTVAIVTSSNFEGYTKAWRKTWGKNASVEGTDPTGKRLGGAGVASDPRRVTDLVAEEFQARFKGTRATPDIATALEEGADYVAIVDMYVRSVSMGSQLVLDATVVMIDRDLREVMSVGHEAQVNRGMSDTKAFDQAMRQVTDGLQTALSARLGPRLR